MKKKKCTKCGKEKELDKFYKSKDGKFGRNSQCKECMRERNRKRYHERKNEDKEEKKINYYPNSYIEIEREEHNSYYYRRPKHCYCNSLFRSDPCMYCSSKETRLVKYLQKKKDNFWDERKLTGLESYRWKIKMKKNKVKKIKDKKYKYGKQ